MKRPVVFLLCAWVTLVGTSVADEVSHAFPTRFAWGELVAGQASVELRVQAVPQDRVIAIPRFNSPYRRIYLRSDAQKTELAFRAEVREWLISLPKRVGEQPVVVIETVGRPQLLTTPAINKANEQGVYVLPAHEAIVHGDKLRYEPQPHKNTLGFWLEERDWCEWKLNADTGRYEVHILQGCGKGQGGSEVEIRLGESRLVFTVEDTGHFQNFKERKVGTLTLAGGMQSLQIRSRRKARVAVMDVRRVRLVPVR